MFSDRALACSGVILFIYLFFKYFFINALQYHKYKMK